MFAKILIGLILIGGGLLAVRILDRMASLSVERKEPLKKTAEDLVRCPNCGIYYQQNAGCLHCHEKHS